MKESNWNLAHLYCMHTNDAHKSVYTYILNHHTGFVLQNGTLKVVDRKKHIFKLSQGEYIAPEKVENIYIRSEAVVQAFVHGDSLQVRRERTTHRSLQIKSLLFIVLSFSPQACLVAIIVPDPDFLPGWAKKRGIEGSYEELCKNKVKTDLPCAFLFTSTLIRKLHAEVYLGLE